MYRLFIILLSLLVFVCYFTGKQGGVIRSTPFVATVGFLYIFVIALDFFTQPATMLDHFVGLCVFTELLALYHGPLMQPWETPSK